MGFEKELLRWDLKKELLRWDLKKAAQVGFEIKSCSGGI